MDEVTQRSLQEAKTNPYDTHPPLKSRIEAAADYPSGPEKQDDDQALSLLEHVEELESELFEELARLNDIQKLKPLAWDDVGEQIYLPAWKEFVARESSYLKGITPASLPEIASNMEAFSKKFPGKEPEERRSQANSLIGSAIAVGLHDRGWVLHRPLNEPVHLSSGDLEITPFRILEDLKEGEIEPKAWQQLVEAAGISDLDLSKVAN